MVFPLKPLLHPNHIISVRYFIMTCARWAWAYETTAEIYCEHVLWHSCWFSECLCWPAASFMHSCWSWPAARTLDRGSSCTAPRRHRACPASVGKHTKFICWASFPLSKLGEQTDQKTISFWGGETKQNASCVLKLYSEQQGPENIY